MKNLLKELNEKILICDGAMGTMLQNAGLKIGECPEEWNVVNKDKIANVHKAYADAGADIVITNTFGANRIKLKKFKKENKVLDFNSAAVEIARKSVGDRCYVFGDIGPLGDLLEPYGEVPHSQAYDVFAEQISVLAKEGVDAIIIETMSDLQEICIAVSAAKKESRCPVVVSTTFEFNAVKNGFFTLMGASMESTIENLEKLNVEIVGTNCNKNIEETLKVVTKMRTLTKLPILAEPNAGIPQLINGKIFYDWTPEKMSRYLPSLLDAKVNIIGGCCGTSPDFIKEIYKYIKSLEL